MRAARDVGRERGARSSAGRGRCIAPAPLPASDDAPVGTRASTAWPMSRPSSVGARRSTCASLAGQFAGCRREVAASRGKLAAKLSGPVDCRPWQASVVDSRPKSDRTALACGSPAAICACSASHDSNLRSSRSRCTNTDACAAPYRSRPPRRTCVSIAGSAAPRRRSAARRCSSPPGTSSRRRGAIVA